VRKKAGRVQILRSRVSWRSL